MTGIVNGARIAIHEATELEVKGMAVVNEAVGPVVQEGVRQLERSFAALHKQLILPIQTGEITTGTTEIETIRAREEKTTTETAAETIEPERRDERREPPTRDKEPRHKDPQNQRDHRQQAGRHDPERVLEKPSQARTPPPG